MAYDDAYHVTRAACIDAYASKSAAGKRAAKANADTKATAYAAYTTAAAAYEAAKAGYDAYIAAKEPPK